MTTSARELDHVARQALSGTQLRHAIEDACAWRYAPGLTPIAALVEPGRPDAGELRALVGPAS